jgi:hypothetical protein
VTVTSTATSTTFTFTKSGVGGTYDGSGATVIQDWWNHGLGIYAHPNVAFRLDNVEFAGGYRCGMKSYGSSGGSAAPPKFMQLTGCRFYCHGNGYETTDILGVTLQINNCVFRNDGATATSYATFTTNPTGSNSAIVSRCDMEITDTILRAAGTQIAPIFSDTPTLRWTLTNCYIYLGSAAASGMAIQCQTNSGTTGRAQLTISGGRAVLDAPGQFINNQVASSTYVDTRVSNMIIEGTANRTGSNIVFRHVGAGVTRVSGCTFLGAIGTGGIFYSSTAAAEEISIDDCDFRQTTGAVFFAPHPSELDNKVRGRGNRFASGNEPAWSNAAKGQQLVPRAGFSPTALTTVANLAPDFHYTGYHVAVGSATTVNNIRVGGSADTNRARSGTIVFVADDANTTFGHNTGSGNIRNKTGANVTLASGDTITYMRDAVSDVWREI